MSEEKSRSIAIVGGGLAGLAAATYLARAGQSVTLYEKASHMGGRGATQRKGDFWFNQGPHALYLGAAAASVLNELGISYRGGNPALQHSQAIFQGRLFDLPTNLNALLTTRLLKARDKWELTRFLVKLPKLDPAQSTGLSVADWLDQDFERPTVKEVLQALCRLSTYTNAPSLVRATTFLTQLQLSVKYNVLYLDGGWQSLVDGLEGAARRAGVEIETGCRVERVERDSSNGVVAGVKLSDGTFEPYRAVVLATGHPNQAVALFGQNPPAALQAWQGAAWPVQAACLDVGLYRLPTPRHTFALGIDQPLYYSVHSEGARLGPVGGAVIHAVRYLPVGIESDPHEDEKQLEAMLDLLQPGWRSLVAERRFLPKMTVCHDVADLRVEAAVPGVSGLYVVGDWINADGWLTDAALGSARQAARLILQAAERLVPLPA